MKSITYVNNNEPFTQLFKVVSSEAQLDGGLPANRWLYVVQPCVLMVLDTDEPVAVVEPTAPFLKAWNVYEIGNTPSLALGLPTNTGSTLQPIPDDAIVPGSYRRGEERLLIWMAYPNQWECDEAAP